MMKKILFILLIVATIGAALISCGKASGGEEMVPPSGAVPVLSNYPHLSYIVPGEYDEIKFEDGTWARYGFCTYVTSVNGMLAVMPSHTMGSSAIPSVRKQTVYQYRNLSGGEDGVFLNGELLIDEVCVGLIPSCAGERVMIVTASEGGGRIYAFEYSDGGDICTGVLLDDVIGLGGKPLLFQCFWPNDFYDAPEEIILVTDRSIVVIHADEYLNMYRGTFSTVKVTVRDVPPWWQYIRPTSAVQTEDGTVFIGEREGVIGITADDITYYPIDYRAALYGDV